MGYSDSNHKWWGVLAGFTAFIVISGVGFILDNSGVQKIFIRFLPLLAIAVGIFMGLGVAKQKKWALRLSGAALVIMGIPIMLFGIFDFIRTIITGTATGGQDPGKITGTTQFLVTGIGFVFIGFGLHLLGIWHLKIR